MRVEEVSAIAFGPLTRRKLEFAPGLTVVYGPNESGKSSWHAALYVGICGIRRGRGRSTSEDHTFELQHKPWDGSKWEVSTIIQLEDGRRVELRFDLAERIDCSARDTVTGQDVSNQIMDGTPDASRWLGLDRRSFLATACIRQAELLSILAHPDQLQEHMQRAAATAGTDATAAAAIARLDEFRRERVGADMVHSRKPLRAAKDAVASAETALRLAQQAHDRFGKLAAEADRARKAAAESERELRVLQAAIDAASIAELENRFGRATELARRYAAGPPPGPAHDEELANDVAAAIQACDQAPEPISLEGLTSSEIQRQLEGLPELPEGDLEPDPEVAAAEETLRRAEQALELLGERPPDVTEPSTGGLGEQRLLEVARDLEVAEPPVDPSLEANARQARAAADAASKSRSGLASAVLAGALAVAGIAMLIGGFPIPGIIAAGGAVAATAWVLIRRSVHARTELGALKRAQEAEAALGEDRYRIEQVRSRRVAALEQAAAAGLPSDPAALRRVAEELREAQRGRDGIREWEGKHEEKTHISEAARRQLAAALQGRGARVERENLESSYQAYVEACRERARIARQAERRPELEIALRARTELESAAGESERIRAEATAMLKATARAVGSSADREEEALQALKEWRTRRATELGAAEVALREWTELEGLLDGHLLDEIEADLDARRQTAAQKTQELDPAEIQAATFKGDGRGDLDGAQRRARDARTEADQLAGRVQTEGAALQSVAEAEERMAAGRAELDRVQQLGRTLDQTLTFLKTAQDRVHHDIAPVLNDTLRRWLPNLTSGRYVDATVDPASLEVRVMTAGGKWRTAQYLSEGTREQIYLLLRIALAEHLTRPGELIPLILDDVTVQCDATRTVKLLEILKRVSEDRQIILFTQEDDVLEWASSNLHNDRDKVVQLDPGAIPA